MAKFRALNATIPLFDQKACAMGIVSKVKAESAKTDDQV
jgi:hypothetical protein